MVKALGRYTHLLTSVVCECEHTAWLNSHVESRQLNT